MSVQTPRALPAQPAHLTPQTKELRILGKFAIPRMSKDPQIIDIDGPQINRIANASSGTSQTLRVARMKLRPRSKHKANP